MTIDTFSYLWEQGIAKAATDVMKDIGARISKEQIERYHIRSNISHAMCDVAFQKYDQIHLQVRKKFFNTGNNDEKKMDGHKICACITCTLLSLRLVEFDAVDDDIPLIVIYSNYTIAFLSAIYIMYLFLLSYYKKEGKTEHYNELTNQATFYFPNTNPGHDDYDIGRIKALALNDSERIDFDILTYADMLFWIEKYNKDLIDKSVESKRSLSQKDI